MWFVLHLPVSLTVNGASSLPIRTRDHLFTTAVEALELHRIMRNNTNAGKWRWFFKTHGQWHVVAVILAEICSRPASLECDQAWKLVTILHNGWELQEKEHRGAIWRPVRWLLAKARRVRDIQRKDSTTSYHPSVDDSSTDYDDSSHNSAMDDGPETTIVGIPDGTMTGANTNINTMLDLRCDRLLRGIFPGPSASKNPVDKESEEQVTVTDTTKDTPSEHQSSSITPSNPTTSSLLAESGMESFENPPLTWWSSWGSGLCEFSDGYRFGTADGTLRNSLYELMKVRASLSRFTHT